MKGYQSGYGLQTEQRLIRAMSHFLSFPTCSMNGSSQFGGSFSIVNGALISPRLRDTTHLALRESAIMTLSRDNKAHIEGNHVQRNR